jgi:hypothetical protein
MLRTFFRHYSLYEYSFKPKVDIILMTIPEQVKDGLAKDSLMPHDSLQEASKMNDEIGDLNLDGPAPDGKSDQDVRSSLNKSKQDGPIDGASVGPADLSKQGSQAQLN